MAFKFSYKNEAVIAHVDPFTVRFENHKLESIRTDKPILDATCVDNKVLIATDESIYQYTYKKNNWSRIECQAPYRMYTNDVPNCVCDTDAKVFAIKSDLVVLFQVFNHDEATSVCGCSIIDTRRMNTTKTIELQEAELVDDMMSISECMAVLRVSNSLFIVSKNAQIMEILDVWNGRKRIKHGFAECVAHDALVIQLSNAQKQLFVRRHRIGYSVSVMSKKSFMVGVRVIIMRKSLIIWPKTYWMMNTMNTKRCFRYSSRLLQDIVGRFVVLKPSFLSQSQNHP
eukprot:860040_1